MTDTLLVWPLVDGSDEWLPFLCCSGCMRLVGRDAVVMWLPNAERLAVRPLFLCSVVCEQAIHDAEPGLAWEKMGLPRFLACLLAITNTHEGLVELFERLELERFKTLAAGLTDKNGNGT